jgi:hypothetical protein
MPFHDDIESGQLVPCPKAHVVLQTMVQDNSALNILFLVCKSVRPCISPSADRLDILERCWLDRPCGFARSSAYCIGTGATRSRLI